MTDFIAKARAGRTIALESHRLRAVMFFPEETEVSAAPERRTVSEISKPMFVRSVRVRTDMIAKAPAPETVANAPLLLTEAQKVPVDDMIATVMKKAA